MADPHVILAPLVEPPLPPLQVATPSMMLPLLWLVAAGVACVVTVMLLWWWRRSAPRRALRRIARLSDPQQAAQQLAQWQQRYRRLAPPDWLQRLEQVRFGQPLPDAREVLQQLCREATSFTRAG